MGDVVTALGRAVQDEGHMVEVIIPKFDCIKYSNVQGLKQVSGKGRLGVKGGLAGCGGQGVWMTRQG